MLRADTCHAKLVNFAQTCPFTAVGTNRLLFAISTFGFYSFIYVIQLIASAFSADVSQWCCAGLPCRLYSDSDQQNIDPISGDKSISKPVVIKIPQKSYCFHHRAYMAVMMMQVDHEHSAAKY